ncbi:MAG: HD domain-containing phosphohydrolase [Nitrospirota bacterium]
MNFLRLPLTDNIHKRVIKRLLLVWILLSIIIGAIVYFVEIEKIDDFVVDLAIQESELFANDFHTYFHNPEPANYNNLKNKIHEHISNMRFITIELYDIDKKKMLAEALPKSRAIIEELEKKKHDFLMADKVNYMKQYLDSQMYLKIFVPIKDHEDSKVIGYFEGNYKIDPKIFADIKNRVVWSVGGVIIAMFATTLILYPVIIALNKDIINFSVDLSKANIEMLKALGEAIAKRDHDTNIHNYRVTIYSVRLAETIGLEKERIQSLIKGAFLHDLGKIGISDNILLKPGKLTEEEFNIMKVHVHIGLEIVNNYKWLIDAEDIVQYHHERFNGSGYIGLKEREIPINARIFTIADYFDALTSKRPYKEPYSFEKSLQILREGNKTVFDPELLNAFLEIIPNLYTEVKTTETYIIENTLNSLINKYFNHIA